jgi:hypothetical protein
MKLMRERGVQFKEGEIEWIMDNIKKIISSQKGLKNLGLRRESPYEREDPDNKISQEYQHFIRAPVMKKHAVFLLLGFDAEEYGVLYTDALIWGEKNNAWINHKLMSLNCYNKNASILMGAFTNFQYDPFTGNKLSLYDFCCIERHIRTMNITLRRKIMQHTMNNSFSEITLDRVIDTDEDHDYVEQLLDNTQDDRISLETILQVPFLPTLAKELPATCQVFMTPNFMQAFDFHGVNECWLLTEKVNFASYQLGFAFQSLANRIEKSYLPDSGGLQHQMRYTCEFASN